MAIATLRPDQAPDLPVYRQIALRLREEIERGTGISITSPDNIVRGLEIVGFGGFAIAVGAPRNFLGGDRKRGRGPLGEGNLLSGNGNGVNLDEGASDC